MFVEKQSDTSNLLEVKHLQTTFIEKKERTVVIDDVSFSLKPGETLGIVGESGSGKSVTSLSIMRLLNRKKAESTGQILFEGKDLLSLNEDEMDDIRGNRVAMIFQDSMTSLNPVFTVGNQITESIRIHMGLKKEEANQRAIEMLRKVGLPRPETIMKEYPFTLSGGMQQRVMIAMALSCNPSLLIADEPTTALDVTIQAQIVQLLKELRKETGMAIMLITHDIGLIAEMADKVIVMYAGQIVEETDVFTLFKSPKHPYTKALMKSVPKIDDPEEHILQSIPGMVPNNYPELTGCRFSGRCPLANGDCPKTRQNMRQLEEGHWVRCAYAG